MLSNLNQFKYTVAIIQSNNCDCILVSYYREENVIVSSQIIHDICWVEFTIWSRFVKCQIKEPLSVTAAVKELIQGHILSIMLGLKPKAYHIKWMKGSWKAIGDINNRLTLDEDICKGNLSGLELALIKDLHTSYITGQLVIYDRSMTRSWVCYWWPE